MLKLFLIANQEEVFDLLVVDNPFNRIGIANWHVTADFTGSDH